MPVTPTFEPGTTFLLEAAGSHLWVILSDPQADPEHVVQVSLTTWHARKEQACILERSDHPWVTHRTCVHYQGAMVVKLSQLYDGKDTGKLTIQQRMSPDLLKRMWQGAAQSDRLPTGCREILRRQGLVR
jgi:hypothetical protein